MSSQSYSFKSVPVSNCTGVDVGVRAANNKSPSRRNGSQRTRQKSPTSKQLTTPVAANEQQQLLNSSVRTLTLNAQDRSTTSESGVKKHHHHHLPSPFSCCLRAPVTPGTVVRSSGQSKNSSPRIMPNIAGRVNDFFQRQLNFVASPTVNSDIPSVTNKHGHRESVTTRVKPRRSSSFKESTTVSTTDQIVRPSSGHERTLPSLVSGDHRKSAGTTTAVTSSKGSFINKYLNG